MKEIKELVCSINGECYLALYMHMHVIELFPLGGILCINYHIHKDKISFIICIKAK